MSSCSCDDFIIEITHFIAWISKGLNRFFIIYSPLPLSISVILFWLLLNYIKWVSIDENERHTHERKDSSKIILTLVEINRHYGIYRNQLKIQWSILNRPCRCWWCNDCEHIICKLLVNFVETFFQMSAKSGLSFYSHLLVFPFSAVWLPVYWRFYVCPTKCRRWMIIKKKWSTDSLQLLSTM